MIVLRNEQLDAFRADSRKKLAEVIRRGLVAQGATVEQRDSTLVLRDSLQRETQLTFAADGLPDSIVRPSGLTLRFEFEASGRLAALIYPSGRRMLFAFDAWGNVESVRQPGFAQYLLVHTESGSPNALLESVSYPDGRSCQFSYNGAGQLLAFVAPSGACHEFERNAQGSIETFIDPVLHVVGLIADAQGALQGIEFPDGSVETYRFDEDQQTAVRTHRDGTETRYTFDELGRLVQLVGGSDGAVNFGYDSAGNLVSALQGDQRVGFTIERNDVTEEVGTEGKVLYGHDAASQLTSLRNPFGDVLRYDYDLDGRLSSIRLWDGRSIEISCNDEDLISEIQYPGGVGVRQLYGPALRLTLRQVQMFGGTLQDTAYHYDVCSRFVGSKESMPLGNNFCVHYDDDDHVVREDIQEGCTRYVYDIKGNMLAIGDSQVTVGPMDEPTCFSGHHIRYDALGNMLHLPGIDGALECKYRHDGLLSECRTNSDEITFEYDALGRRICKRAQGQVWRYGWAGFQLLWEESRFSENATPLRRDYLFLPGSVFPLGFREQGKCYWLMTDARGAVDLAIDEQGKVVWKARYNSFGLATLEINAVRQPWRMLGQYADEETGLYYNFARYYSPYLHSYLSLDPRWMEFAASHYSYCCNDPWNRADPFGGLAPLLVIGLAGAVVGGLVGGVMTAATGGGVGDVLAGVAQGAVAGGVGAVVAVVASPAVVVATGALIGGVSAAVNGGNVLAGAVDGAIGTAGALVAVAAGATAAGVVAAGVVATGAGAFASKIIEQATNGDQISVKCALKSAAYATAVNVVLLGLGKVAPMALNKASAVSTRLRSTSKGPLKQPPAVPKAPDVPELPKTAKPVPDGSPKPKKPSRRERDAKNRADLKDKQAVKKGKLESKAAKIRHPDGLTKNQRRAFKNAAKETKRILIVRDGNADSVKFQGKEGYIPKPVDCKANTAKFGPDAGIVVDPTNDVQKKYWDIAESTAGSADELAAIKTDRAKAEKNWNQFKKDKLDVDGSKFKVNDQGQVLLENNKIYGDCDLHGVYDVDSKNKVNFGIDDKLLDAAQAEERKKLNQLIDPSGNSEPVQHGCVDDWILPAPPPEITVKAMPPVTVFMPDGQVVKLATEGAMEQFYKDNGLPWPNPYPRTNMPAK